MKYQAVLFDLDGTLLNTIEDIADAMNATLTAFGFPTHSYDAYKIFVGDGIATLVRRAIPKHLADEDIVRSAVDRMRSEYDRCWDNKTRPYPGVPEMLDVLDRLGIKKAILSNKPHDFTLLTVGKLLQPAQFDAVLGARSGVPVKPDAQGARDICNTLSVSPEYFAYLGDTDTDMQTATAAGMLPIGAAWGFRSVEELQSSGARFIANSPMELIDILKSL